MGDEASAFAVRAAGEMAAVAQHLLSTSERTTAHCTFLTTRGTMAESSALPIEWARAQAQWTSATAGWVSWLWARETALTASRARR